MVPSDRSRPPLPAAVIFGGCWWLPAGALVIDGEVAGATQVFPVVAARDAQGQWARDFETLKIRTTAAPAARHWQAGQDVAVAIRLGEQETTGIATVYSVSEPAHEPAFAWLLVDGNEAQAMATILGQSTPAA